MLLDLMLVMLLLLLLKLLLVDQNLKIVYFFVDPFMP